MTWEPQEEKPQTPSIWRTGPSSAQKSTMLTKRALDPTTFLSWKEKRKSWKNGQSSGKAPSMAEPDLPDSQLMEEYLDKFDSISNKLHDTKSFHDNRDVSTTYLGRGQITRDDKFHPQLSFLITSNSHTYGKVIGGNRMDILLDTGASKSYMSKAYYMRNSNLHALPKYETHIKSLQVGKWKQSSNFVCGPNNN